MDNTTYLQRFKSLAFKEMGAEIIFILFLLTLISHLYTSIFVNVTEGNLLFALAFLLLLGSLSLAVILAGWTIVGLILAFYDYINIVFADTEFTLDFYAVFFITTLVVLFIIFLIVETGVLSSVLAIWKMRLPNIASGFLGLIIGIIVAIIVNRYLYVNIFYGSDYDVIADTYSYVDFITIFSPGILEILILIYVGWKINDIKIS